MRVLFQAVPCCCAMSLPLFVAVSLLGTANGQSKRPPPANSASAAWEAQDVWFRVRCPFRCCLFSSFKAAVLPMDMSFNFCWAVNKAVSAKANQYFGRWQ